MKAIIKSLLPIMLGAALMSAFQGCGDENTRFFDTGPNNGRVVGSVNGRVLDGITRAIVSGAVVSYADNSGIHTTTTNANGYYLINGLETGDYIITVAAGDDFSTVSMNVTIPSLADIGIIDIPTETDFHQSVARDFEVFQLNSAVAGMVYKRINNGEFIPGQQVQVVVDYSNSNLSPAIYTATSDATGHFSLANLPSAPTAILRVWPFQDGTYAFAGYQANIALSPGNLLQVDNVVVNTIQVEPFIIGDNITQGRFGITDNIVITYNKAMDEEEFDATLQGQSVVELGAVTWSSDHKTVTIHPDEALRLEQNYTLSLVGLSLDNSDYQQVLTFTTQLGIDVASTSLQPYDGNYTINPHDDIIIRYSEAIDIGDDRNVFRIDGSDVAVTYQDSYHTVVIDAPAAGYSGVQITLNVVVYSLLAEYDNSVFNRTVAVRQ